MKNKKGKVLSVIGMLFMIVVLINTIIEPESFKAITLEDVMDHSVMPTDEFIITNGGNEVMITDYKGSDPIVVVPNEINGKFVRIVKIPVRPKIYGLRYPSGLICIYDWNSHKNCSIHIYNKTIYEIQNTEVEE